MKQNKLRNNVVDLKENQKDNLEETAFKEEQKNLSDMYSVFAEKIDSVKKPNKNIKRFDTATDYDQIDRLQDQKYANKKSQDKLDELDDFIKKDKFYVGHINIQGNHCFFTEYEPPLSVGYELSSRHLKLVHIDLRTDRKEYNLWKNPGKGKNIVFSRNVDIEGKNVIGVAVTYDESNELYSEITDSYLRKALLQNKSKQGLQSIIKTIQGKQDEIRQTDKSKTFVVQGCAGSGKTMVLLHRIRYLLVNKDIDTQDFWLITPSNDFKAFIAEISKDFGISELAVKSFVDYYRFLLNKKDEIQPADELVFSAEFLNRVYSEEFLKESYRGFVDQLEENIEQLCESCESKLDDVLKEEKNKVATGAQKVFDNAVEKLGVLLGPLATIVQTKVSEQLQNAGELVEEIVALCNNTKIFAEKEIEKMMQTCVLDADVEQALLSDASFAKLCQEIQKSEDKVAKAGIFTRQAHQKKLDQIKQQAEKIRLAIKEQLIAKMEGAIDERKKALQNICEGVSIEDALDIAKNIESIAQTAKKEADEIILQTHDFESVVMEKYQNEIRALQNVITSCILPDEKISSCIENLEPCFDEIDQYIKPAEKLFVLFSALLENESKADFEKSFAFFAPQSLRERKSKMYQKLFNGCRKIIKKEFNLSLCNQYKHYWYLNLYCKYLAYDDNKWQKKYVFIDEAQDLSPAEIRLVCKLNTQKSKRLNTVVKPVLNLFGDLNQRITQHGVADWKNIAVEYDEMFELSENFRNTNQVIRYCNRHLPFEMKEVGVDMNDVKEFDNITQLVAAGISVENATCIVKDEYCKDDLIQAFVASGVIKYDICTVKQAKGIEFKTVIVFERDMTQNEKYISYTRALSQLYVVKNLAQTSRKESKVVQGDLQDEVIEYQPSSIDYQEVLRGDNLWQKYKDKTDGLFVVKKQGWFGDFCMVVSDLNTKEKRLYGRVYLDGKLHADNTFRSSQDMYSMYESPNEDLILQNEKQYN